MKRHEIKYLLSYPEYVLLKQRLSPLLERDSHNFDEEGYLISSVYFDDFSDSSFREKLYGVQYRSKYRLRYYNRSSDFITLEHKKKTNEYIEKESLRITPDEFYSLASGDFSPLEKRDEPLAKQLLALSRSKLQSPRLFCEYVREAYVHPLSDTRITFDKYLEAAPPGKIEIENKPGSFRVFPGNEVILEVKYNRYLPQYVSEAVSTGRIPESSSKYEHSFNYLSSHYLLKKGEQS